MRLHNFTRPLVGAVLATIGLGLGLGLGLGASSAASLSSEDKVVIDQVSAYLNTAQSMEGSFVQVGPDGTITDGRFYMKRPGRMRFEYTRPTPILVVSDGTWLILKDTQVNTVDRYPLSSTPLKILLAKTVELWDSNSVRRVEREDGIIRITALDPDSPEDGEIVLIFTSQPMELRQWIVTDAQGQDTTVAIKDLQLNLPVSNGLFHISDENTDGSPSWSPGN